MDKKALGAVIAERRKAKKISQEVLSGFADIGRSHLSEIECGKREHIELDTICKIAAGLGLKMSDFVFLVEKYEEEHS